jgi:hypothetical protein
VCSVAAAIFGFAAAGMGITSFSVYVDGVETSATVIKTGGARQGAIVEFRTRDGHLVRADVPGSEVGRTGDSSRIRYPADDPTNVVGAGKFTLAMHITSTIVFAYVAFRAAVFAHGRIRHQPRPEPTPPDRRIVLEAGDPAPARELTTARAGTARRRRKAFAALSVAGAALITYRRISRRPKQSRQ